MNPVTVQLLNEAEKYRRSEQVEVCQLVNQAHAGRTSRPSLREWVTHILSTWLSTGRSTVGEQLASPDTQLLGGPTE